MRIVPSMPAPDHASAPLITTGFDATSTAADVTAGMDLHGLRAIVTGGSSGLGLETARALAAAGAEVTVAVRDAAAGSRAASSLGPPARIGPGRRARPHRSAIDIAPSRPTGTDRCICS